MATKKDQKGNAKEAWEVDELEQTWYESTRQARDREDQKINDDFMQRQNQERLKLTDLYNRRSQVQNELEELQSSILYHEQEQERLSSDYQRERSRIASERQEDDQVQRLKFERLRQEAGGSPNSKAKTNGRRASNRDMGASQSGGWVTVNGSNRGRGSAKAEDDEEPPTDPGNLLGAYPMDDQEPNGRGIPFRSSTGRPVDGVMDESNGRKNEPRPLKPKQRHSLPSFPAEVRSPMGRPAKASTPSEPKGARSPSGRRSLPSAKASATPVKEEEPMTFDAEMEITQDNLVVKYSGGHVSAPDMYAGAPLERIHEKHPYWDPEWQSLEDVIQPQLDKWNEKLDNLRRQPDAIRHTVFLANRQVNRGALVMDFLKTGEFHPYQFVGKDMMAKFYKTFINYDTMFRLVNVHEELKKFDLDVTPLEWLRQRMYEIAGAQGDKFSLSKITHDLYHDAKLKYLREKHGFGNIGRPSGYKLGSRDPNKGKEKVKRQSAGGSVRKKGRRSIGQVDADESMSMDGYTTGPQTEPQEQLEPVTPRLQKRQRLEPAPPPEPEVDDLEYDGYTSTDSFSAGRIMHLDWRVYQIKTHALTTSTEVTQYWTWAPAKESFEHQVLRDVFPKVTWGFYQKPINFDLKLGEIKEIQYAPDCPRILVVLKDEKRGNVLAHFKRERTRKRFLSFARKKGVQVVRMTAAEIDNIWNTMESEVMPDGDSSEN